MADDDKNQSLHQLSLHHRASIISHIVSIARKWHQQDHRKFLSFISSLQCLQPQGTQLRRTPINAFCQRRYVALSYTWDPSEHEDKKCGQYLVEDWDSNCLQPSGVRNCVLDRVVRYMHHTAVRFLWIDAHCIRQNTCGVIGCTRHSSCVEQRDALQAMDLVYQLSEHPVALLGRPLKNRSELHLLKRILTGVFVAGDRDGSFRLSAAIHEARAALSLLCEITRDRWWERAWTFQENYRGGPRMQLLIRHHPSLEPEKLRYHRVFRKIPGELCVLSVTFFTQATQLCLALRAVAERLRPNDTQRIDGVLRAAGRYTLMLDGSSCMTPTVIADIEARGLTKPWDRLALVANCCQYPVRLNGEALRGKGHSLSLSVLAMCLLNGEILDNSNDNTTSAAGLKTSELLERLTFRGFSTPADDTRYLTFNKGCRLTNVVLTKGGIVTKGHLWKLGRIIDTSKFGRTLPWINEPSGRLTLKQRKRLLQLVLHLKHRRLAEQIDKYLAADADAGEDYASFTEMYLHRMAVELAAAIRARRKLRLGSIWEPTGRPVPYRAVFVWSGEGGDATYRPPPAFVFTSAWQRDSGSQAHDANDIDRHVSLAVELEEDVGSIPHLRVRGWLLGMCFFDSCPRTTVVFPWPQGLQVVKP